MENKMDKSPILLNNKIELEQEILNDMYKMKKEYKIFLNETFLYGKDVMSYCYEMYS